MTDVKICGLSTPDSVATAVDAGARYVGFVFFPPSPRNVTMEQVRVLAADVPAGVAKVGLVVAPDDDLLDRLAVEAPLDMLQVHKVHDTARLAAIRARVGLPLIAAMPIASSNDIDNALLVTATADMVLFDAKPPEGADLPGGNGISFDWDSLVGRRIAKPWMLAGGLTPDTVSRAINLTGAPAVDVSSGVETAPGVKDSDKIRAFLAAAGVPRLATAR